MAKIPKIVLAGYYGYGNLGDELIKENIVKSLKDNFPAVSVTVLEKKVFGRKLFERKMSGEKFGKKFEKKRVVKKLSRYNLFKISKELIVSDIFMLGGGSLLQDRSGLFTLYYYLCLIAVAKIFKSRVVLFNQGVGPIKNIFNFKLTGLIISKADVLIARDRDTQAYIKRMISGKKKVFLGADPVFYEHFKGVKGAEIKRRGAEKKIAFAVRNWKKDKIKDKITKAAGLLKESGTVYNIRFHGERDSLNSGEVKELSWAKNKDIWDIIRQMDILAGMRLHSLICGAISGIPMVGIGYDPKVESFCRYMDIPVLKLSELRPQKLAQLIKINIGTKVDYRKKTDNLRERYIKSLGLIF
ncbi:MAG: polysaccharide pyruvyl transferase family protein [Elusimicrobia bacterium]|jgi:polysaccharide pyruvyl transferase CsaB|nr:polysaccharide pyruvyl transferase family protein [Elusimicrobiota bacterium]